MTTQREVDRATMRMRKAEAFKHQKDCKYLVAVNNECKCVNAAGVYMFCVQCGAEYTLAQSQNLRCCTQCGSRAIPAQGIDDVTLQINWGELKTLVLWAETFAATDDYNASQMDYEPPEGYTLDERMDLMPVLKGIVKRLQAQYPSRQVLTLSGELAQIRKLLPDSQLIGEDEIELDDSMTNPTVN